MKPRTFVGVAGVLVALLGACSSASGPAGSGTGGAAGGKGNIGDACPNGTTDCASGLQCAGEDPGGQCFRPCAPSTDADCGDTSKYACSYEGHCYVRCTMASDCKRAGEGYVCKSDIPPRPPVKFCDVPLAKATPPSTLRSKARSSTIGRASMTTPDTRVLVLMANMRGDPAQRARSA